MLLGNFYENKSTECTSKWCRTQKTQARLISLFFNRRDSIRFVHRWSNLGPHKKGCQETEWGRVSEGEREREEEEKERENSGCDCS